MADIIKKNKLKVILMGLITTALILTFCNNNSRSSNNSLDEYEEDKDYLFNQKVSYDFNGGNNDNNNNGKGEKGPSYVVVGEDSDVHAGLDADFGNGNVETDETISNNDNDSTGKIVKGDNDSTGTIVKGDDESMDTEFYTLDEEDKKIDIRVQELKNQWAKSQFVKDFPTINFEDTVIGATAKSLSRHGFKPRAALVMWITDFDVKDVVKTINSVQTIYNNWLQYPWILISATGDEYNNMEWMNGLKNAVLFDDAEDQTKISLQIATKEYYDVPDWIDMGKVAKSRNRMRLVPHGDSMKFRQYTRYITGFLATEPFMANFDWMWNLKPGTELLCDIDYDMFRKMQDKGKLIGIAGTRIPDSATQENVWKFYKTLKADHKELIAKDNFEKLFLKKKEDKDKDKDDKFESCDLIIEDLALSNLNFWRSQPYQDFYAIVDKDSNIFHDGWTIDTVQSLASALLTKKDQFQFFDHLGFQSDTFTNCPINDDVYRAYRCKCDQGGDMTFSNKACSRKVYDELRLGLPDNWDKHKDVLKK